MAEKLARRMVQWQLSRSFLEEKDRSLYEYAYRLLFGQTLNVLIACLAAWAFHAGWFVAAFLSAYIPLRSFAGGHHADSDGLCTLFSTLILCGVCLLFRILPDGAWRLSGWGIEGLTAFLILRSAPVESPSKPLRDGEKRVFKRWAFGIWLLELCLLIACLPKGIGILGKAVLAAHGTASLLLLLGIIKYKNRSV